MWVDRRGRALPRSLSAGLLSPNIVPSRLPSVVAPVTTQRWQSPTLSGFEPPESGLCGLELRGFFSPVDILDGTYTSLLRAVLHTVGYFRSIPNQSGTGSAS